jgi:hypothetical protein
MGGVHASVALARQGCTPGTSNCCSPEGLNYYGEGCLYANGFLGVSATLRSDALSIPNPSTSLQHVINDIYIVNDSSANFIEAGIFEGHYCNTPNGTCGNIASPTLFWGDRRQSCSGCYYAHFGAPASLYTDYPDKISQLDNTDWTINLGSCNPCYSINNSLSANLIRAGTEETAQSAGIISCSAQKDLQWRNSNGVWSTNGWGSTALTEEDTPPYAEWLTTGSWVRDWAGESYSTCWP